MPRQQRSNRGGSRTGTPGKAYSQRTDLNQAVKVGPSQQYGQAAQQTASQQAIPLPNSAAQQAQLAQAASQPAPGPSAGPSMTQPSAVMAGALGALNRPSDRAHEPVTQGVASGAGGGPEMLAPMPVARVSQTLAQIAEESGNADLMVLARQAQAQGQ